MSVLNIRIPACLGPELTEQNVPNAAVESGSRRPTPDPAFWPDLRRRGERFELPSDPMTDPTFIEGPVGSLQSGNAVEKGIDQTAIAGEVADDAVGKSMIARDALELNISRKIESDGQRVAPGRQQFGAGKSTRYGVEALEADDPHSAHYRLKSKDTRPDPTAKVLGKPNVCAELGVLSLRAVIFIIDL